MTTQTGTFSVVAFNAAGDRKTGGENTITWDSSFTGTLIASKAYTVTIGFGTGVTAANFRTIDTGAYSLASGITDYWASPVRSGDTNMAAYLYYDSTSVPEPATIILTGSALAAGAIGAYFKRRRKPQTEIAA